MLDKAEDRLKRIANQVNAMRETTGECYFCYKRGLSSDEEVAIDLVMHLIHPVISSRTLCNLSVSSLNFSRRPREVAEAH
jgi:hypothetical protein